MEAPVEEPVEAPVEAPVEEEGSEEGEIREEGELSDDGEPLPAPVQPRYAPHPSQPRAMCCSSLWALVGCACGRVDPAHSVPVGFKGAPPTGSPRRTYA
jgi:hypothetical protein